MLATIIINLGGSFKFLCLPINTIRRQDHLELRMALSWKFGLCAALLAAVATAQSPVPEGDIMFVDMPEITDETADYYFPTDYDYSYDYDYGAAAPTSGDSDYDVQVPVVTPTPAPVAVPTVDAAPVPEPSPSAGFKACTVNVVGAVATVTALLL